VNNQLTIDELRAYQAGQLDGPARHRVERLLLEDPFYADALEGLEALQQVGASLPKQTAKLRLALDARVRESATERRLFPLWVGTMAASIVLVMGVAFYLIYTNDSAKKTLAQQPKPAVVAPIEVDMGTQHPSAVQRAVDVVAAVQAHQAQANAIEQPGTPITQLTKSKAATLLSVPTGHVEKTAVELKFSESSLYSEKARVSTDGIAFDEPVFNPHRILYPERAFGPNAPEVPEVTFWSDRFAQVEPAPQMQAKPLISESSRQRVATSSALPIANFVNAQEVTQAVPTASATIVPNPSLITGQITDKQGVPLPGVTVQVKGTNRGTTTDGSGRFSLEEKLVEDRALVAAFIGYTRTEFPAAALAKGAIQLGEDTQTLNEVVMVGYGRVAPQKRLRLRTLPKPVFMPTNRNEVLVHGLTGPEADAFKTYVSANASVALKGPLSVRVRTNRDGSVRNVSVENDILVEDSNGQQHREFPATPEARVEAERLVRAYPNWPRKRQWLHWVVGFQK
jgi:hypothetical protein